MTLALRFPRGLYGVTPEWDDTQKLLAGIHDAHAGGMQVLQWRRKLASTQLAQAQLDAVIQLCLDLQLPLLINDNWQVATTLPVAGAHVGRDDGELTAARAALPNKWLGCSCYDEPHLAEQALKLDVDYVAFGAMYSSSIKPHAPRATLDTLRQGLALCKQYATDRRAAVVAIGGITLENAAPLIEAGVDSIAVISGLFEAPDIYAEARAFSQLFNL